MNFSDKLKLALASEEYDKEMQEYFRENRDVYLEYIQKEGRILLSMIGINWETGFKTFNMALKRWLTPFNRVFVSCGEEISKMVPLEKLEVDLVDFSGITFANNLYEPQTLLRNCAVNRLILPLYPKEVRKLWGIMENSTVKNSIDFNSALKDSIVYEVGPLMENSNTPVIDLTEVNLSWVWNYYGMFLDVGVNTIILPKSIGSNMWDIKAECMFDSKYIREIKNLEYFPFDALVSAERMFANLHDTKIEINSKLEKLENPLMMFNVAKNVNISLPEVEELPNSSIIFYSAENCKIYLPKLREVGNKFLTGLRELDDSNEIFCSRELAEKLVKS